jgi:hypothetical protein
MNTAPPSFRNHDPWTPRLGKQGGQNTVGIVEPSGFVLFRALPNAGEKSRI